MPLLVSEQGGIGLDLFGNWLSQPLEQVSFWSTDIDQANWTLEGIFDKERRRLNPNQFVYNVIQLHGCVFASILKTNKECLRRGRPVALESKYVEKHRFVAMGRSAAWGRLQGPLLLIPTGHSPPHGAQKTEAADGINPSSSQEMPCSI